MGLKQKDGEIFFTGQSPDVNPREHDFHFLKTGFIFVIMVNATQLTDPINLR